jgi:hypothetical protein
MIRSVCREWLKQDYTTAANYIYNTPHLTDAARQQLIRQ